MVKHIIIRTGRTVLCECSSETCNWRTMHGKVSPQTKDEDAEILEVGKEGKKFDFVCTTCSKTTVVIGKATRSHNLIHVSWTPEIKKPTAHKKARELHRVK